jgi:hypothetical protein
VITPKYKQDTEKAFEYLTLVYSSASLNLKGDASATEGQPESTMSIQTAHDNLMLTKVEGRLMVCV